MVQINFYKDGNLWIVNDTITPSGKYRLVNNGNDEVTIIDDNNKPIFSGLTTSIKDELGNGYADFAALIAAVGDFFVNASSSGVDPQLEARVANLENKQTLFIDYWKTTAPASPLDGDIWFDSDNDTLSVYNNGIWMLIPLSTDSVYVDRNTNQQYSWSGTTMTSMTVPLTKASIESLIYSPKLTVPALAINLALAEVFEKALTGATSFTITNPIKYKGFRIRLTGGSLNTDLFTGYTENWILNSLITDYVSTGSWLNCEIRESNNIHLFWGE